MKEVIYTVAGMHYKIGARDRVFRWSDACEEWIASTFNIKAHIKKIEKNKARGVRANNLYRHE